MIMSDESMEFLSTILDTPSPTGMEMDAQRLWAEYIKPFTDEQQCDAYGSTWAVLKSSKKNAPTLMLDAHADEIGFSIRHIGENGFVYVEPLLAAAACVSSVRMAR